MFFGLTKEDLVLPRWKTAAPFFLLLFLSFALLLAIGVAGFRERLIRAELRETEQLLDKYLLENRFARLQFGPVIAGAGSRLHGLEFLIINRGTDRLLIAGENTPHDVLRELLHLGKEVTEPWYTVSGVAGEQVLTVIKRELDYGVLIQAGKISNNRYLLFHELLGYSGGGLVFAFVLSWLTGLYCARKLAGPLIRMKRELEALSTTDRDVLLPVTDREDELGALYNQVNRVLANNHRLVEEMRGALDNVAHDLRTPMTRLRSVAEFGLQEESDTEKLRESLADCLEESERVLAMLKIMMSVAEAESGTMQLTMQPLDLSKSLEDMIALYEYVAEEKRVDIRIRCSPNLYIMADKAAIAQVWANLLDNAIKYGKEGGWIEIEAEVIERVCQIRFRDNGMGISESEQSRIWERLYRGDRSRSQQGLGLGLNFVKAVVEAHGGKIKVVSALHEGSCFIVSMKLVEHLYADPENEKSQTSGEWSDRRTSGI